MKLKTIRTERKMTQKNVACAASISRAAYSNIENGKRKPSVKTAKKIATVLDCEWTQLYEP